MLPSQFRPQSAEDFIGPARAHARTLEKLVAASLPTGSPLKVIILGPPGTGKTELGHHLVRLLGCTKWHIHQFNGTQMKIEQVEEIARSLQYREMFGQYRILRIEEVDKVPAVAQVRLLTLLDELPSHTAVVATSNCTPDDLEERFDTRFIPLTMTPPKQSEIEDLLRRWSLPDGSVKQIATFACGNVRQALLDATLALAAA
jgi:replication-associated recombination protein RarA